MIRVHVVRQDNVHHYVDMIDRHHCVRFDIFCRELGWKDLISDDDRERDQFDTSSTIYLLVTEDDERPIGGCRLHPSTGPTLLSDVFPQLGAVRGWERAPDVLEMTRGWVVAPRREERPCRAAGAWKAAALEYCLATDVRHFNGVWGAYLIPRLMGLGWAPRFLGLPETIDGHDLVAAAVDVTIEKLERTWDYYGFPGPVSVWNGIRPKADVPLQPAVLS